MIIKDSKGEWVKKQGKCTVKGLKKVSDEYKEEKKTKTLEGKKEKAKQQDLKKLSEIDAQIYKSIPDIIQKFLPLLETLGFELTKEQKKLFSERKSLKEKLK